MDVSEAFQKFLTGTGLCEQGRAVRSENVKCDYGAFSKAFYELKEQHGFDDAEALDNLLSWYKEEAELYTNSPGIVSPLRVIEMYQFPRAWAVLLARETVF